MGLDTNLRQTLTAPHSDGTVSAMQDVEFDLRRSILVVWRAKWLVALFGAIGIGLAYSQLLGITPIYTAESRVMWELDQTNFTNLDPVASGLGRDWLALASQIEVIESGRLLERVVTDLELAKDPVFNAELRPPEGWTRWLSLRNLVSEARAYVFGPQDDPKANIEETPQELHRRMVTALRDAVEAEWLDNTYVLIIRVQTINADRSTEIANEMAQFYMLDQLETKFEATRQATNWLTERVADLRVELEAAEQTVEKFSAGMTLISEAALVVSTRQLKDLRVRADSLAGEQVETESRLEAVASSHAERDYASIAALMREPRLETLADQISRLEKPVGSAQHKAMIARFDAEFERARTRMAFALERLEGQEITVRKTIVELELKQSEQGKALVQLRQLQREAEASGLIYEFFLSRLKETSVQEGVQRPDARILTKADRPMFPSYPNRRNFLMVGGGGGMLLALALVFLFERLNVSFRSTEELEIQTGHAVIGTIPMAPMTRRRAFLQYLIDKPTSRVAEAIRNLRTSILLANVDNPPQVIMLTSALPGEGKTTCVIALAQISEALGKRVLLVECDIRRRTFRHYFDLPVRGGLLSVLSGANSFEDVVHFDKNSGLYILPGEESSVNAADIFASHRFTDFIKQMRQEFDFIFIDTPPVLAVPDARVIARNSDAVIFCVHWNKTARDNVLEGLRFFAQIHIKVAGLVLSKVNVNKMAQYGYTSYGYYKEAAKYYNN